MKRLGTMILLALGTFLFPATHAHAENVVFIYRVSLKCSAKGQLQTGIVDSQLGPEFKKKASARFRAFAVCDVNYHITYVWIDTKRRVYHLTNDEFYDTASFDKSGKKTVHRDGASWARKGNHNGFTAVVGMMTTIEGLNSNSKASIKFFYSLENGDEVEKFYAFPRGLRVVSEGYLLMKDKVPVDLFGLNWGGPGASVVDGFGLYDLACKGVWKYDPETSYAANDPSDPEEGPMPPTAGTLARGVHEVTEMLEEKHDYSSTGEDISTASFFYPKFISVTEQFDANIND